MTIETKTTLFIAGTAQPANTVLTLSIGQEAELVARGVAVYTRPPVVVERPPFVRSPVHMVAKKALGWVGQSNERSVAMDPAGKYNIFFRSIYTGQMDPIAPSVSRQGSWWVPLADRLAEAGIYCSLVNGAIGSISFIRDVCGQMKTWSATTAYFKERTGTLTGDAGDKGDLILVSGQVWRCTTGNGKYVAFDDATGITLYSPGSDSGATIKRLDYVAYDRSNSTLLKSGSSQPNFASITTPGQTISDGGLVWTLVSNTSSAPYSGFTPFARTDTEFDRLGILARLKTALDNVDDVDERWFAYSNGQGDVGGTVGVQSTIQGWYDTALRNICDWGTNNSYKVLIGFTCSSPTNQDAGLDYQWQTLDAAWAAAVAAKANGTNIFAGANLYRALGKFPKTYPQTGYGRGLHLTAEGMLDASNAWYDALRAAGW